VKKNRRSKIARGLEQYSYEKPIMTTNTMIRSTKKRTTMIKISTRFARSKKNSNIK
jgi:hypothetical protein